MEAVVRCPRWRIRSGGRLGDGGPRLLCRNRVVGGILRRVVDGLPPFCGPLEVGRGTRDLSSMTDFSRETKQRRDPRRVGRRKRAGQRLIYPMNLRWNHLRDVPTSSNVGAVESDLASDRSSTCQGSAGAFQFKSVSRSRLLVPNFSPPFELRPVVSLVGPAFNLIVAYAQPTAGGGTESNL